MFGFILFAFFSVLYREVAAAALLWHVNVFWATLETTLLLGNTTLLHQLRFLQCAYSILFPCTTEENIHFLLLKPFPFAYLKSQHTRLLRSSSCYRTQYCIHHTLHAQPRAFPHSIHPLFRYITYTYAQASTC